MPISLWPQYADHPLAPKRRSRPGSNMPVSDRWEVTEVKAESKNLCETLELDILEGTKEVTKTIRTGGLTPQRGCPNRAPDKRLSSPVVLMLMEPNDAALNAIMRKNK
jgi:hypothetical protein